MRFLTLLLISICCAFAVIPPLAPPSIVEDVPVVYFGPRPSSEFDAAMVGPTQILRSSTRSTITIDEVLGTITVPLYKGSLADGSGDVWYIVTDASTRDVADLLGVSFSSKLSLITDTNLMRTVTGDINENLSSLVFSSGFVDFAPVRDLIPGDAPNFYPLGGTATVGAVGDTQYSPLAMHETLNVILNAPIIASSNATEDELNRFCDGIFPETVAEARGIMHDKVVSICPRDGHVTLQMTDAFSYGRPFWYLALESSDINLAIVEAATHVPLLSQISTNCFELDSCPTQIAMTVVNGVTNQNFTISENLTSNPFRQGLFSAALSEGSPLHVMGEITTLGIHNSPLWDIFTVQWTDQAIMQNLRVRVHDIFEIFGLNTLGWINNWQSGEELISSGIVFNAPPVYRLY